MQVDDVGRRWLIVVTAAGALASAIYAAAVLLMAIGLQLPSVSRVFGAASLAARLSELEGLTGLDPLDPTHPLSRADVLGVGSTSTGEHAQVRFSYADGSSRVYDVWVSHPRLLGGWQYTGIDRIFATHEELPALPFAGPDAPLHVGMPVRLSVIDSLLQTAGDSGRWFDTALLTPRSTWSPRGDAVLLGLPPWSGAGFTLWLVPTDGRAPTRLAEDVVAAQWTSDGASVVYLRWLPRPQYDTSLLTLADRAGNIIWSHSVPSQPAPPFATARDRVLWVHDGALWGLHFDREPGAAPERLRDLPDARVEQWGIQPVPPIAPAPAAERIAYVCGADVCLAELRGGEPRRVALPALGPEVRVGAVPTRAAAPPPVTPAPASKPATARPGESTPVPGAPGPKPTPAQASSSSTLQLRIAWSPDGRRLAVARSDRFVSGCDSWRCYGHQPRLALVDDRGRLLLDVPVGPNGFVDTPQWTPDGAFVFLPAYPQSGRRIVAVETATGRVYDLSKPRWDAFFSLSPDGTRLLLTNGRGGFWMATLRRTQPSLESAFLFGEAKNAAAPAPARPRPAPPPP